MGDNRVIDIVADEKEAVEHLARFLEINAKEAIESRNQFTVGLSGGSLVSALTKCLPTVQTSDWSKWIFFFCDERVVPNEDPESTFGCYQDAFITKQTIPISKDQFITIDPSLPVERAAEDYALKLNARLKLVDGKLRPDVLLLGMGPDGHTASLFPNHTLLCETSSSVAAISDSPKPPPCRVTLTFPVINNARSCIFTIIGKGKAEMIKRILKDKEDLPAGRVSPSNGTVVWIVDKEAASLL